jgi:hypothetical protein
MIGTKRTLYFQNTFNTVSGTKMPAFQLQNVLVLIDTKMTAFGLLAF